MNLKNDCFLYCDLDLIEGNGNLKPSLFEHIKSL